DRRLGWNWTHWREVQRPLLEELGDSTHTAALTAPLAQTPITADAPDIGVSTRHSGDFLYLIAVRKSPAVTGKIRFSRLPAAVERGTVLAHPGNPSRQVAVANGSFTDPSPYAPHNARVYRFTVPSAT